MNQEKHVNGETTIQAPESDSPFSLVAKVMAQKTEEHKPELDSPGEEPKEDSLGAAEPEGEQGDTLEAHEDEALFTVTDEEGEEILTAKQAQDRLLTRRRIDREFSKLDKDRKELQRTRSELEKVQRDYQLIDAHLKGIHEAALAGRVEDVNQRLALMSGDGAGKMLEKLVTGAKDYVSKLDTMTDEELSVYYQKVDLESERAKVKKEKDTMSQTEAETKWTNYTGGLKQKLNISDEEMTSALQELMAEDQKKENGQRAVIGNANAYDITNRCASRVLAVRKYDRIIDTIKEVAPGRESDVELLQVLVDIRAAEIPDDGDLKEVIQGLVSDSNTVQESKPADSEDVSKKKAPEKALSSKEATLHAAPQDMTGAEKGKRKAFASFADLASSIN